MIFVQKVTASAASQIDLPLPSGANGVLLRIRLSVSSNGTELRARVTTDNFSTVKTGASDYRWTDARSFATGNGKNGSLGDSTIVLTNNVGSAANRGAWGSIMVHAAADSAYPTMLVTNHGARSSAGSHTRRHGGGAYLTAAVVNGVRLYPSAGTITGAVEIYRRPT